MARFGIIYLRSFELHSIRISGRKVNLAFPASEAALQKSELGRILFEDCYHLETLPSSVSTVLDIGANTGCFAIAARHFFPNAKIHCYEPNQKLEPTLSSHCKAVDAERFMSSVGKEQGKVSLDMKGDSLFSVSREDPGGQVTQEAFRNAVAKLKTVDLLKLDCEGAEWDIFSDAEPWDKVKHLTMEYHLWAIPGSTTDDLRNRLKALGFTEISIDPSPHGNWGFAYASKH